MGMEMRSIKSETYLELFHIILVRPLPYISILTRHAHCLQISAESAKRHGNAEQLAQCLDSFDTLLFAAQ